MQAAALLPRLVVEVARDPVLGPELALRGGAALHHLHLDRALRRCDTLAYARTSRTGIGPVFDALRVVTQRLDLTSSRRELTHDLAHVWIGAGGHPLLRVTINTRETEPCEPRMLRRLRVGMGPGEDEAQVLTFVLEEVLATKLRALYERREARDVFDLWAGLVVGRADRARLSRCFRHYVPVSAATAAQLRANVAAKVAHPDVREGVGALAAGVVAATVEDIGGAVLRLVATLR